MDSAEASGFTVLTTRPTSADARLPFGGLGDLLRNRAGDLGALPSPQAHALGRALSLESGEGDLDVAALAAGVLNVVVSTAEAAPVLIAVDDAQWLDWETERLLAFALRRLRYERVGLLATVRLDDGPEPQVLLSSLPDAYAVRHVVGPLTVGAVHDIIRGEIGSISRPLLLRLHEASGGNPLYALELARALAASGHEPEAGEPLTLPPTLERLTEKNLALVDDDVRETLLVVALLNRPRERVVAEALDDAKRAARNLERAENARLVAMHRDEIRFTHPLVASVLVASTPERQRRDVHRRLATAAETSAERIRHLALATSSPDASVASALDEAASVAHARAAPAAAAELAEHALHLTPPTDGRELFNRNLRAGRFHHEAGASARGRELLTAAVACASTGPQRAAGRLHLATATVSSTERLELLRAAAAESEAEPGTRAEILAMLGSELPNLEGPGLNDVVFAQAVSLAEDDHDQARQVRVLCLVAWSRAYGTGELDIPLFERALELSEGNAEAEAMAATTYGCMLAYVLEAPRARELLSHVIALEPVVDQALLADALDGLGLAEWAAGNWNVAVDLTERAARLAGQLGAENHEVQALGRQALVAACRGDVVAARAYAERSLDLQVVTGNEGHHIPGLALLELSLERYQEAYDWVLPYLERKAKRGIRLPYIKAPIAIEALAHLGRHTEALEHLRQFESDASHSQLAWAGPAAARCHGFLAAENGDFPAAERLLDDAVEGSRPLGLPFELGQSLLALGVVRRRLQRKLLARETLEEARHVFDALGARLWIERVEAELRRIGGRRHPAGSSLSEIESQIAALVAMGQTNSEVASTLQISRKTVEWNLSKIYRKLRIRSRTELALLRRE